MMNINNRLYTHVALSLLIVVGSSGLATVVHGQVPSTNDTSDQFNNTGVGTGALSGNGVNSACSIGEPALKSSRCYNTALGYDALSLTTIGGNYNSGVGFVALYQNTTGFYNTATGAGALEQNTTGQKNTAFGFGALSSNILDDNDTYATGSYNTAVGSQALYLNTIGNQNTAIGLSALYHNTTGTSNTATGAGSLYVNTSGGGNTANGLSALGLNTTGNNNTASGYYALFGNTTGAGNTASGVNALDANTVGSFNTASGINALTVNSTGANNSAMGSGALFGNSTGARNSALGSNALYNNASGNNNIGIGYQAGYYPTTGSNNIEIGAAGAAADNAVIRIGTQGTQKKTYLAGVRGVNVTGGVAVMVTSTGQLGVVSSSRRYKEDVHPMGDVSDRLLQLRPVTFRYKQPDESGNKPEQYGLIAEEVAKVMPELVIYNDKGQPETIAYQALTPLLVNELQRENNQLSAQLAEVDALRAEVAELRRLTAQLAARQSAEGVHSH